MTADLALTASRFETGRIVRRAIVALQTRWLWFLALATPLVLAPQLGVQWVNLHGAMVIGNPSLRLAAGLTLSVLQQVLLWHFHAAVIWVVRSDTAGSQVTLAGTVARIWSHSAAIAAAGILAILGMIVGTVLLVIPGVIVGVSLSMTTAAVVVEDRAPLAALKRSRELTRGHLWVLSALFLGWLAVSTTTAMIEVAICSPGVPWFTAMTAPLFALIVNPISATLLSTVLTVGVATAYLQLADLKRSAMAETFD